MKQFTSLCSHCRHGVLFTSSINHRIGSVSIRYASSLSAIHRGLRDSEKSRPQGFERRALTATGSGRAPRNTSRSRRDPDWAPPTFKLSKGKKDITDQGPQPKSRKARFHDPDESFGKKSLVYQLKHGALRDKLAALSPDTNEPGNQRDNSKGHGDLFNTSDESRSKSRRSGMGGSFEDKFGDRVEDNLERKRESRFKDRPPRGGDRFSDRGSDRGSDYSTRRPSSGNSRKQFDRTRSSTFGDRPRMGRDRNQGRNLDHRSRSSDGDEFRGLRRGFESRPSGDSTREAKARPRSDGDRGMESRSYSDRDSRPPRAELGHRPSDRFGSGRPREWQDDSRSGPPPPDDEFSFRKSSSRDDLPVRIHHTTAASQFLYGRSVVEAALKDSRRQLYRLYVYAGEDRRNLSQDAYLEKLADQKGVKIEKVGRDGQRMMDKMSGGRPHNGCILEASPIPQIPLKNLGALSEDPAKPGFSIEVAHQSAEEAAINGAPDFVSYRPRGDKKPFILFLDSILDPGNLGAILRTAAFLGVTGVVITKHSTATITPVALKASAGASEVLPLYSVTSTLDFIERSKEAGWVVYASVAAGPRSRGNSHLTLDRVESYDPLSSQPTILAIGSEGEGLGKPIRRVADFEISIPGQEGLLSTIDSLNVSVATGILCSAFLKKPSGVEIEDAMGDVVKKEGDGTPLW
ncbi:hypothetical protein BJ170DRAFT_611111 [Xylariales sp. AK1849]|nr:hypothetical protein BJ170DRAFT_611111 [Xylariales sp. AK1849]